MSTMVCPEQRVFEPKYFSSEYRAYHNARQRCINQNHPRYADWGGRGIKFLFNSFQEFMEDIGPKPSPELELDRANNEGHYEKGNIRWSTVEVQCNNRRKPAHQVSITREKLIWLVKEKPFLSVRELASLLDISQARVHQLLQDEGINKQELREQWFEDQRELVKLFEQAHNEPAVAIYDMHPEAFAEPCAK